MLIGTGMDRDAVTLTWNQTLDRRLVHRDALAEVLLTDAIRVGESSFEVAAQWPRSHRVYRPDATGRHDPMLVLETIRQTGLALSHIGFDVPFGHRSIMRDIGFEVQSDREPRVGQRATNVSISVECVDVRLHHGNLRTMTVILSLRSEGVSFATGTGTLTWMPAATFVALRARNRPESMTPAEASPTPLGGPAGGPAGTAGSAVGSAARAPSASRLRAADDALITLPDDAFPLRRLLVPLKHPVYFDHPLDHVPGLLLIDAVWQAAAQTLPEDYRLHGGHMECPAFTELSLDALISLGPTTEDVIGFEIRQRDKLTTTGELRIGRVG